MTNRAEAVQTWLRAGASVSTGLLLLSQIGENHRLTRLVCSNPHRYKHLLVNALRKAVGIDCEGKANQRSEKSKLRDDYPFLRQSDCPTELKVLVADRITAFERYTQAHNRLFDCTSLEECYQTAFEVVSNYIENRSIYAELEHYKEHKAILGRHRIFKHLKQLKQLQSLSILELITQQRRLRSAIWRIDDEIKKGTKPHLLTERMQRKNSKATLLAEIDKFIEAYKNGK